MRCDMSRYQMFFSSAKAERELGYAARPYKEGLKDALAWFRDNGYLQMIAGMLFGFVPLAIWLYLLLAASRLLAAARARQHAASPSLNAVAAGGGGGAGAQRGRRDPAQHRQPAGAGLSRPFHIVAGRRSISDDGTAELAPRPLQTTA